VAAGLTGSPSPLSVRAATTSTTTNATSPERLAAQQRRYAAQDRAIRPETFRVPDLRGPAVKRAAARAGVDLRSRASIDAADRRYAAAQARPYR
jgi:hypothetical protein